MYELSSGKTTLSRDFFCRRPRSGRSRCTMAVSGGGAGAFAVSSVVKNGAFVELIS